MWIIKVGSLNGSAERLKRSEIGDEIIVEVSEKIANDAASILKETMIQARKAYLFKVPIEVEVTVADTWAEK